MKLTPAARQRQEIQNTILSFIQRTATDADGSDDELDLAFSSMAKHMHLHLSKTQKKQVLFKTLLVNASKMCWRVMQLMLLLKQTDLQLLQILCMQILQMLLLETNWVSSQGNNNSQLRHYRRILLPTTLGNIMLYVLYVTILCCQPTVPWGLLK